METGFPTADYHQIMKDDRALLDWLELLDKMGFVLVRNVPVEEGPVPALQVRAGFEKLTHYGPGYTVVVRPDPANISHTYHRIFFHTDLTYYDYMPGVGLFATKECLNANYCLDCVSSLHCSA